MPRSNLLQPNFRLKLLLALLGTVGPLLIVTLLVVRHEAASQVEAVVASTAERAEKAFAQIERIRQQQLDQLGARAGSSSRWGQAMQQALEGDAPFLLEHTRYELELAGFPNALVAFTSLSGEPVAAIANGRALGDPAAAVSTRMIDHLFAGDSVLFGYHVLDHALYSVHPTVLGLGEPVGIALLGFAIDNETARALGQALGADVCFMAGNLCAASWSGPRAKQYTTVMQPLAGADNAAAIRLRIPLDEVIRPFDQIQLSLQWIGLVMLALAALIALFLSRGFARPILDLVGATSRVARGDYSARVEVRTRDELGTLANAFNEMTHGLMLKERYRGVLDKVVSRDVADEMLKGEISLGGELREVTTLFADIRGFTPMSEHMPPQEVVTVLNEVLDRAEAAVVEEGGVVDKYVGDEIMALFGAPMSRGSDAARAVRAALRMQAELALINQRRRGNGEPPLSLGIGINTGSVVAGNMGSARRLNYTVIGAAVNLAARLCAQAEAGQILISEATRKEVKDDVQVRSCGKRAIKGLSAPIEVFQVIAAMVLLLFNVMSAHAQRVFDIAGIQVQPAVRVDAMAFVPSGKPAWLMTDTSFFAAPRVSALADIFAGRHLYAFFEARVDRGETPSSGRLQARIEQAFLRASPWDKYDVSVQAGRFASPFGNYPNRHHSTADPLIRPPLSYDYRTVVSATLDPLRNNGFLTWKDAPETFRPIGLPPVWAVPYQLGAMFMGSAKAFSWRLALMNTAPSSDPPDWNWIPARIGAASVVAHLEAQLAPELKIGASYDRGPYQRRWMRGREQLDQRLVALEATYTRWRLELRAEAMHDTWRIRNVNDDAVDISYYMEAKLKLSPGWWVASRYSAIDFNRLTLTTGDRQPWDYDTRRLQFGGGYRFSETLDARVEMMLNRTEVRDPKDNLLSVQGSWLIR